MVSKTYEVTTAAALPAWVLTFLTNICRVFHLHGWRVVASSELPEGESSSADVTYNTAYRTAIIRLGPRPMAPTDDDLMDLVHEPLHLVVADLREAAVQGFDLVIDEDVRRSLLEEYDRRQEQVITSLTRSLVWHFHLSDLRQVQDEMPGQVRPAVAQAVTAGRNGSE